MRISPAYVLAVAVAASTAALIGQTAPTTVAGHVSINTSSNRRTTAVSVKRDAKGSVDAMFCVSHAQPLAEKLAYEGTGKVLYRSQPIAGLPAGVKITGPEPIAPALAVVPSDGKAMMFLGKGQSSPLPAADPAMKTATTFQVGHVARQDWEGPDGRRRGTDVEACLSPGG